MVRLCDVPIWSVSLWYQLVRLWRKLPCHLKNESLKIGALIESFCPTYTKTETKNYWGVISHETEEWCQVWRKLILDSKNDMGNFVNFNASSSKSDNLHFGVLLLSIAYKVSDKNVQKNYHSWHWKKDPNFEEKLTFYLKNDLRNLVNFNLCSGKSENLHFDGLLL